MKNVLIALDYGPSAVVVAEKGYELAVAMDAAITLVHVVGDVMYYSNLNYSPIMGFNGYMDIEPAREDIQEKLRSTSLHFLEQTRQHLGDDKIGILVKEGHVADAIADAAKEINAGVIIMGSHSRSRFEEILVGNVTGEVLRQSIIPLFIVPVNK